VVKKLKKTSTNHSRLRTARREVHTNAFAIGLGLKPGYAMFRPGLVGSLGPAFPLGYIIFKLGMV
jgi:hypothetical protein